MDISKIPTLNSNWEKKEIKKKTDDILKEIGELQYKMYAQKKYSLLVIFQGLDASGKDGLTKGLLKYCNPVGISIKSFKKPNEDEYAHDFLWRVHKNVPAKGMLQVFIRSHYEDILVPSVEGLFPDSVVEQRYELINNFEKQIQHNDTKILKFFLNVSSVVQKERLMERLQLDRKHWKHQDSDWKTREKFDLYMNVYQKILDKCSIIPWYPIPADKNWQKLYAVAVEVNKTLKSLDISWPKLDSEIFID